MSICLLSLRAFFWPASGISRENLLTAVVLLERSDTNERQRGCAYFSFPSTQQVTPRPGEERPRYREPMRFFDPLRKGRILIVARPNSSFFYFSRLTNLHSSSNRVSKERCVHVVVRIFQRKLSTSKTF